jgi:hypothetical protein
MTPGLRLDQGPPFAVPLGFFLVAPLFLAAAGLAAGFAWHEWTASRWSLASLAIAHLIGLGYLGMAMLGALTQMAPVAAGAVLPGVLAIGRLSLAALFLGTPLLAWGLARAAPAPLLAGAGACALGLGVAATSGLLGLGRAPAGATRQAMRLALLALLAALAGGLALAAWLAGAWTPADPRAWVAAHAGVATLGWVGLLVVGSAYQVVPMLQITPNYPAWATRRLGAALAALLALWLAARLLDSPGAGAATGYALLAGFALFALLTLSLQARRRRKLGDATLAYWRLGMASLLAACALAAYLGARPPAASERLELLAGILFLLGFAASVVNGMLFKIVPFLAWFHLQAQQGPRRGGPTSMKDFYPDAAAERQLRLHAAALALLAASPWWPVLAIPGGALLAAASLDLAGHLYAAARLFRAKGGRFLPA